MTKKKRNAGPTLQELLERPFCYYCDRDFEDMKILTTHQKAKHLKCNSCSRRLNTAGGLAVHMLQVHKSQLEKIEGALPQRAGIDVEIFGMEGMPPEILKVHQDAIIARYNASEAQRTSSHQAKHDNQPSKRPKHEAPGDLKKRLAAHRAKRAEEAAAESNATTPITPADSTQDTPDPQISQQPVQPFSFEYMAPIPAPAPAPTAVPITYPFTHPVGGYPAYTSAGYAPQYYPGAYHYPTSSPGFYQEAPMPSLPATLPPAVGLPQRPEFANTSYVSQAAVPAAVSPAPIATPSTSAVASSPKDTTTTTTTTTSDKPVKMAKEFKLVFSSNDTSPEEFMARIPRFATSS